MDMWTYECLSFVSYAFLHFYVFIGNIQVFVKTMVKEGKMLVISLRANDTVKKFKQLIQEKKGISVDQHLLCIAGTGKGLLKEELTVSDFG